MHLLVIPWTARVHRGHNQRNQQSHAVSRCHFTLCWFRSWCAWLPLAAGLIWLFWSRCLHKACWFFQNYPNWCHKQTCKHVLHTHTSCIIRYTLLVPRWIIFCVQSCLIPHRFKALSKLRNQTDMVSALSHGVLSCWKHPWTWSATIIRQAVTLK